MSHQEQPNPVEASQAVHQLLARLHAQSLEQEKGLTPEQQAAAGGFDPYMRDKFIALDQDKCQFIYHICRTINAKQVVEVGTSFGVSTIYWALAVRQNARLHGDTTRGRYKVVATENEPSKIEQAKEYWQEAGQEAVAQWIELREGDLNETLKDGWDTQASIDVVVLDIWAALSLSALRLLQPHLRSGAVIFIDNTIRAKEKYKDLLQHIDNDKRFSRIRLPYAGGLDMCRYEYQ